MKLSKNNLNKYNMYLFTYIKMSKYNGECVKIITNCLTYVYNV